jgi:putative ribosome biogenesis GTPase RsgA
VLSGSDGTAIAGSRRACRPSSHIARRDGDGSRHPIVSNVDRALIVMGLDDDYNLRRLERYLTLAHGGGVAPLVVLTKADLLDAEPARRERQIEACASACPTTPK